MNPDSPKRHADRHRIPKSDVLTVAQLNRFIKAYMPAPYTTPMQRSDVECEKVSFSQPEGWNQPDPFYHELQTQAAKYLSEDAVNKIEDIFPGYRLIIADAVSDALCKPHSPNFPETWSDMSERCDAFTEDLLSRLEGHGATKEMRESFASIVGPLWNYLETRAADMPASHVAAVAPITVRELNAMLNFDEEAFTHRVQKELTSKNRHLYPAQSTANAFKRYYLGAARPLDAFPETWQELDKRIKDSESGIVAFIHDQAENDGFTIPPGKDTQIVEMYRELARNIQQSGRHASALLNAPVRLQ